MLYIDNIFYLIFYIKFFYIVNLPYIDVFINFIEKKYLIYIFKYIFATYQW